jgi:outer membrane protein TolC
VGLEQITGKPTGDLKKLREDLPMQAPVPNDAKAWVDAAMETNPTILADHYAVSADEHKISAARAGHLPTISATLNYGKFGSWSSAVPGSSANGPGVTTVGLVLNVPIFSGGLTQSQVRQAIYQRDEDQGTLETSVARPRVTPTIISTWWWTASSRCSSARTSVEAATKSVASMRAGYAIGTQSLTNVVFAIETAGRSRVPVHRRAPPVHPQQAVAQAGCRHGGHARSGRHQPVAAMNATAAKTPCVEAWQPTWRAEPCSPTILNSACAACGAIRC